MRRETMPMRNWTLKSCLLTFFLLCLLVLLAMGSQGAKGNTITVDDDGHGDHTTIQDAMDAARESDTIRVWEGTYYENVLVNKTVNVVGNGSGISIINGNKNGNVVRITANWVNLSGFSMIYGGSGHNAGIKIESSFCTIFNNNCSVNTKVGIWITSSAKNNMISANNCSGNTLNGIQVEGSYNTIQDNLCQNNVQGIYVYGLDMFILNNTVRFNDDGIRVYRGERNQVSGNNCSANGNGILLRETSNNEVANNSCHNNSDSGIGIYWGLNGARNNRIENNWCVNDTYGIYVNAKKNTFVNNVMEHCGFYMSSSSTTSDYWDTHTMTDNMVNSKPVYYYSKTSDLVVPKHAGQVIIASCTNITVENQNLSDCTTGLSVGYSTEIQILNNSCNNNGDKSITNVWGSMGFLSVEESVIDNNSCDSNDWLGVYMRECYDNTITNNTFARSATGVYLTRSDDNRLENNTFGWNRNTGLLLKAYCDRNILSNNLFISNTQKGLSFLSSSNSNSVQGNTISGNDYGIYHSLSEKNIFEDNVIFENNVGLYVKESSKGNHVHYNEIYNNTNYGVNANNNNGNVVNCSYNWWRAPSGPYHPTKNPDGKGDNVSENVQFEPWTRNPAPAITTKDVRRALEDSEYSVHYEAEDKNNDSLEWSFQTNASFLNFHKDTRHLNGTPLQKNVGSYWVNISVSDGEMSDEHNFTLTVIELNEHPVISTASGNRETPEDEEFSLEYEAEDEEDDKLTWSLSTNATFLEIESGTGLLNGTPRQSDVGSYWVNITVSDGELFDHNNFTLTVNNMNDRPKITTADVEICLEDHMFFVDYNATDEDWDVLSWSLATNAGFLIIDSKTGDLTGRPEQKDVGSYWVNVTVSDKELFHYSNFTLTVTEVNERPTITTTDPETTLEDTRLEIPYTAEDEEQDVLTWSLTTNASFLDIDTSTGILSGTPGQEDIGSYWVNVTASDNEFLDFCNFTLTVLELNERPTITTTDTTTATEDLEYSATYTAEDEERDPLTWSLATNAGFLEMNSNTGLLTGTPTQERVGSHWVNVSVSDGKLASYHNFTLEVVNVNDQPEITITAPVNNTSVAGGVKIRGTAADVDSEIQSVEIRINDGGWQIVEGTTDWSFMFNTTTLGNGNHSISARAFDGEEYSDIVTVKMEKRDVDNDGVLDDNDAFPDDPAASKDSDGDRYPDEWNEGKTKADSTTGLKLDKYPDDPDKWVKKEDDGGFLSGFEMIVFLLALISSVHIFRRKK